MSKSTILSKIFFRPCTILFGVALIVSYCSVYINPIHFWIPAFFGLYFVPLVIINALFLLFALLRRSSMAWIPFISLLPTLLFAELFVRWGAVEEVGSGLSIKIATYNVCNFQGYGKKTREVTITEISRFLEKEQIDIVCMQEFFCTDTGKIREWFPAFPYHCFDQREMTDSYQGNTILSRYPIEHTGTLPFPDNHRSCIYADFNLHGREFRVYTTHFQSNNISLNAIVDRIRHYQEVPDGILQAHINIRDAFLIRPQQVEIIDRHLDTITKPFILCGDFNDTPVSYTYHRLQEGLSDSFRNAGKGFGATFRYLWPALRIDYILYSQPFSAKTHLTKRVPFSDHYPVITELVIL